MHNCAAPNSRSRCWPTNYVGRTVPQGRARADRVLRPSDTLRPHEALLFPHRYFKGTVYSNLSRHSFSFPEAEWDRILLELQALKPEVLEGESVYLLLLARAAKWRRVGVPSLRTVILTFGKASRPTQPPDR